MQTIPGEPILTIRGAYPAFNFDQTIALISGLDIFLDRVWNLNNNKVLTYNGMVSFLYHRDLERGEALYFMPGNSLWNELSLQFSKALNLSISNQWIFQQKLIPTTYMDYAPPPPTYTLVGAAIAYSYKYKWRLRISVDNAFNQKYRDFLDRFRYFADASGTNLKVQWTFYFNSKTN
jgi:iron complex outermembrane recepter protein